MATINLIIPNSSYYVKKYNTTIKEEKINKGDWKKGMPNMPILDKIWYYFFKKPET